MGCKIRAARKLLGDLKENIQWETQEIHGRTRVILVIDKSGNAWQNSCHISSR